MTRPTARVLALLEILQSGGTRTVGDLTARLGVDERAVRHYVAHPADREIPVHSVRRRYGDYRLTPGYRMPPLMLTDDEALAEAPHRHAVSLRVQGTPTQVRSRLPAGLATVHEIAHLDGWVRVRLQAERLDWLPAVLAGLDLPFAIEHPDALRDLVRSLAERFASTADASLVPPMHGPPTGAGNDNG